MKIFEFCMRTTPSTRHIRVQGTAKTLCNLNATFAPGGQISAASDLDAPAFDPCPSCEEAMRIELASDAVKATRPKR
jgi:hypothetical protein